MSRLTGREEENLKVVRLMATVAALTVRAVTVRPSPAAQGCPVTVATAAGTGNKTSSGDLLIR